MPVDGPVKSELQGASVQRPRGYLVSFLVSRVMEETYATACFVDIFVGKEAHALS